MKILRTAIYIMVIWFPFGWAQAEDYTQEQWVDYVYRTLPGAFCGADQYFRQCFEADEAECKDRVLSVLEDCIDRSIPEIPEVLSFDQRRHWGSVIEKCLEKDYVSNYGDFLIDSEQCKGAR